MKTPFLGCAYYPEDWDESEIDYDISKMKEAGIRCARIGEFAWRRMEPECGKFDFGWLHHVVDSLYAAGISVVMGTPTATPPIWLSQMYGDVFTLGSGGTRSQHGGRRHCCSNNPHYLEASDRIVHAMGREFGSDPAIIGWQLDNEIYTGGTGCTCEYCMKAYHDRLKKEYGTIENLNARWDLNLFSQAYDSFDEIPGDYGAWHNPHLKYEWSMAHHDSDISFMHRQADILRLYTKAPIGTDMMPLNGMGYEDMCGALDVVMFNHYNVPGNISDEVFWFDFLRTIKEVPFWNTETAATWNGSTSISQFLKPEGYCRLNSWLPVALGGESNMYWLWRQHWAGHELVHGSVLTPEGRPVHVFGEIQQTAREFDLAADFINSTRVDSPVALHYTSKSWNLFEQQRIFDRNNFNGNVMAVHRAITDSGIRPDVIGSTKDVSGYKVVFSPLVMTLEDNDLGERMKKFVCDGGVWVCGPMTDIRNSIGAHYTDRAMGILEDFLGVRLDYQIPTDGTILKTEWNDGTPVNDFGWVENYTIKDGEALASVTAGHSSLIGETVIAKIKVGLGEVILCGTLPDAEGLKKLIGIALEDAGVSALSKTGNVNIIPRSGSGISGLIVCEMGNAPASVSLPKPMTDVFTGATVSGTLEIEPYGVYVLKD